jgi:hypothetical protein
MLLLASVFCVRYSSVTGIIDRILR